MTGLYYCRIPEGMRDHDAGLALLRAALRERFPELPAIAEDQNGKPYFPGHPDLHFNLSHSKGAAVCAVSDSEVGIDLEQVRPLRVSVSRKFTEEEQRWLESQPEESFFSLWVKKEAVLKCTGSGLLVPLNSFSVLPVEENTPLPGLHCRLLTFPLPGWQCAVCGCGFEIGSFRFIDKEEL